jgi:hypothetical protein
MYSALPDYVTFAACEPDCTQNKKARTENPVWAFALFHYLYPSGWAL